MSHAGSTFRAVGTLAAMALMLLGTVFAVGITTARPAEALCAPSDLDGHWENIDSNTDSITQVDIATCQPKRTCNNGTCTITHGAATFMNPYGACSPTDCDWGRKEAKHKHDGWIRTVHDFGFKTSYVWAKTYEYGGRTYLRVWTYNDFTEADGRDDYSTNDWLRQ